MFCTSGDGQVRRMRYEILAHCAVAVAAGVVALHAPIVEQNLPGANQSRSLRQRVFQGIDRGRGRLITCVIRKIRRRQRRLFWRETCVKYGATSLGLCLRPEADPRPVSIRGHGFAVRRESVAVTRHDRVLRRRGAGRIQRRVIRLPVHLVAAAGQQQSAKHSAPTTRQQIRGSISFKAPCIAADIRRAGFAAETLGLLACSSSAQ